MTVCRLARLAFLVTALPVFVLQARAALPVEPQVTSLAILDSADPGHDDWNPSVATDGSGRWVAVWNAGRKPYVQPVFDLAISRSTDDGATWSAPSFLAPDQTNGSLHDSESAVATGGSGTWVVVWGAEPARDDAGNPLDTRSTRIFVVRSVDNAETWTVATSLDAAQGTLQFTGDARPAVATSGGGVWVIVWEGSDGQVSGIYGARSLDDGLTWSPPQRLSQLPAIGVHSFAFPGIVTDGSGVWVASWHALGTIDIGPTAWFVRSVDEGATWGIPQLLVTTGAAVNPRIASDRNGPWVAVWSDGHAVGSARSNDAGATWTESVAVSAGAGNHPDISVDRDGAAIATWRQDSEVSFSWFRAGGTRWSVPSTISGDLRRNAVFSPARVTRGRQRSWVVAWESEAEVGGDTHVALSRVDLVTTSSVLELAEYFVLQLPAPGDGPPLARLARRLTQLARKVERRVRGQQRAAREARKTTRAILRKVGEAARRGRLGVPLEPIEEAGAALLSRLP